MSRLIFVLVFVTAFANAPCFAQNIPQRVQLTTGTASIGSVTSKPTNSAGAYSAATVGTSSGSILAASTATVYLEVINDSPTATVCVNVGSAATISGTTCAAGEIPLGPIGSHLWNSSYVPSDQIFAIASASSTPVTVGAK